MDKHAKQLQAMLFAIENYPSINRTKLMNYIFFMDLFAYNNYGGKTIFEDTYYCLRKGPVPDYGFSLTCRDLVDNEYFSGRKEYMPNGEYYNSYSLKEGVSCNLKDFSRQEIQLLKLVLIAMTSHPASEISDKTHSYQVWDIERVGEVIDPALFYISDSVEKAKLNEYLNTAAYVSPIDSKPKLDSYPKKYVEIGEKRDLPVFINRVSGEII